MPLYIKNPETERLARELAALQGMSVTETITKALQQVHWVAPVQRKRKVDIKKVLEIIDHCASLPVLDDRTADEILGYDDMGLPT